jgi:DNA repair protein RecO (recombination protein O)
LEMNAHISPAIIMRIKGLGESDLLVTFFTSDRGRLKGVAKGAQRSKKRFANCLDLFCLTSLEYELKRKGSLYFLHSGKLIDAFPGLRSDFSSLSLASYMVELTEILFPLGVADTGMFELLKNSFFAIDKGKRKDLLRIQFEARAMALGGYGINFDKCCNCGRIYTGEGRAVFKRSKGGIACLKCQQESKLFPGLDHDTVTGLRTIQSKSWNEVEAFNFSDKMIREIKSVLNLHMEYRIGRRLKTAEYLVE